MKKRTKIILLSIGIMIAGLGYFIAQLDSNPALFIKMAVLPSKKYKPTELPKDTTSLFTSIGNIKNDIAFVFVQGGPALKRNIDNKNPLLLLPNSKNLLKVYPLQSQMINQTILSAENPSLTKEQGAFEHNQSVEILHRTISYLKNKNKNVYVICHSYGTLIGHQYLNTRENLADKIVLMGFPLDMDLRTFDVKKGEIIFWKDGTEPIKEDPFPPFPLKSLIKNSLNELFANMFMLINTNAKKRFTKLLMDKNLSNVIYVYAKFDEASGRPTNNELDFLRTKNVEVLETFGGHHSMWTNQFMSNLYYHFAANTSFKKTSCIHAF